MEIKIQKSYIDYGCGFPVLILNAPFKKVRGEWALYLDFKKYEESVLLALAVKKARLTGNEVRFIRHLLEMDLKTFGKRFGDVAHSAVIKWEKTGDEPTNMSWSTEKDIRLAVIEQFKPRLLRKAYKEFQTAFSKKPLRLEIDTKDLKSKVA